MASKVKAFRADERLWVALEAEAHARGLSPNTLARYAIAKEIGAVALLSAEPEAKPRAPRKPKAPKAESKAATPNASAPAARPEPETPRPAVAPVVAAQPVKVEMAKAALQSAEANAAHLAKPDNRADRESDEFRASSGLQLGPTPRAFGAGLKGQGKARGRFR